MKGSILKRSVGKENSVQLEVIVSDPESDVALQPIEVVFVHGSCHIAQCWQPFQQYFAQFGYRSIAFSLRGHGASLGHEHVLLNRLSDYVTDLEQVVRKHVGTRFILIGHSFGGYIIQSYLYQQELPRPVGSILLASCTPLQARKLSSDVRTILRNFWPFLRTLLTGNARMFYKTAEQTRYWFFTPDTPQAIVDNCFHQLQDESFRASTDVLRLPSPENQQNTPSLPMLILGAERDTIIPVTSIKASAEVYHAASMIFTKRGHDLMLDSGWEEVAAYVVRWIKDTLAFA